MKLDPQSELSLEEARAVSALLQSQPEGEASGSLQAPLEEQLVATISAEIAAALAKAQAYHASPESTSLVMGTHPGTEDLLYCPDCYLPLHPDPNPEKLYIFLHALRYTTSLGTFETEVPAWTAPGFEWDRSL